METTHTTATKNQLRNPLKIYFLLISLVGVIGTLVAFGTLFYTVGKQVIITNEEYVIGDRYYEIEACSTNMIPKPTKTNAENYALPTEAEKEKCKEEKKVQLIQSRKVMFKTDVLAGAIWGILFLALLLTHYPRFIKITKKGE